MKKIPVFLFLFSFIFITNAQDAFKLSGDIRTGSGFAPLFGLKTSNSWTIYYSVDLQHKSGFGIGGYRLDDFSETGLGRIAFFDAYWAGKISKNQSLYTAIEYGFFDNDKTMSFICPYVIWSIQTSVANFDLAPLYCYYNKLESDQVVVRGRMVKNLTKSTTLRMSGWYNNLLSNKFYAGIGITQSLPKNFYLQGDILLWREGKNEPMISLGYKF